MSEIDKMARELLEAACFDDEAVLGVKNGDPAIAKEVSVFAIRAALLTAPPGWRLVPVNPTRAMISAGHAYHEEVMGEFDGHTPRGMFIAMLSAAPEPK